jgi:hypothetical protein
MTAPAGRNPFQPAPGATPPAIVGREAELASIDDGAGRVARGSAPLPLAFVGLRGLGKTVLLNAVADRTAGGVHLRVEVERGVRVATSIHRAIRGLQDSLVPISSKFGKAIETALRFIPLSYEPPGDIGEFKLGAGEEAKPERLPVGRAISVLNDEAVRAKKYLTITLDEVHEADLEGLRSVIATVHQSAQTEKPIFFACAGLPETSELLDELPTYVKRWDTFELAFLSRAESIEGVRLPLREAGVTIEDRALDLLVEQAAGYPFFLQRYASAAWNRHSGKHLTLADVEATLGPVRALVEKTFYADEFRRLSPRERLFCKVLADLGPGAQELGRVANELGVKSSEISSIRGSLIKKGTVFVPSSGDIQFRMPLADRYVREHPELFDDEQIRRYRAALASRANS